MVESGIQQKFPFYPGGELERFLRKGWRGAVPDGPNISAGGFL